MIGVLLVLTAMVPSGHADHARSETQVFVGPSLNGGTNTVASCAAPANVGDVCFVVLPGESSADLLVADVLGRPVAALARVYDASFVFMGSSGQFCGFMDNLSLGAGAAFVVAQPLDPVNAEIACGQPGEQTEPALVGTVTVGFH